MSPEKTSSFQLPNSTVVDVVFIKLPNGKIVPRHPDELIYRRPAPEPTSPASTVQP